VLAAYIGAACWFTAPTSFANPAAAFGRMFSDSFADVAPENVPGFVAALLGAATCRPRVGDWGQHGAHERALVALSTMVGAVLLARAVDEPGLSDSLRKVALKHLTPVGH